MLHLVEKRKINVEWKYRIIYIVITVLALVIVSRSAIFRLTQMTGSSVLVMGVLNLLCILVGYHVICLTASKLLKEAYENWIVYFVSWMLTITLIAFVFGGAISNEIYVVLYCIGFGVSLLVMKIRNENIVLPSQNVWKARLKFSLPVSIFLLFTLCIYLPSELYMGNPEDFKVGYLKFILPQLAQFVIYVLIYLVITLFFVTKHHYYVCNISGAMLAVLLHVQNMFLNGKLHSMDGVEQQWNMGTIVGNGLIWVAVLLVTFICAYYKQKKVRNVLKVVSYGGIGIQVISLVILLAVTPLEVGNHRYVLSTESTFKMAPKENVIVFVLDWYDNQIIDKIIREEPDFLEPLDGFTYYPNTTSRYAFTDMSVVYLLTGKEWKDNLVEKEYAFRANEESDVLERIAASNYTLGIYTLPVYVGAERDKLNIENGTYATISLDINGQLKVMSKTTRYKAFPFALKNYYHYSDDDINGLKKSDIPEHDIYSDISFANRLLTEGITVDDARSGAFKFYHLHAAHKPYRMTEEYKEGVSDLLTQSRASMEIVYTYLEQLKRNGLYENATIIITADHGQNYYNTPHEAEELDIELISSPILFVKEAGEAEKEMEISLAPVSHDEIVPTILETITGDTHGYGKTLHEISEDEERVHEFIYGRHDDIPFVRYDINGDVRNIDSWSEPILIYE